MRRAAAAQCGNVAVSIALAEAKLRHRGVDVRNPLATNAVDPCLFADHRWMADAEEQLVGVVSTTQLVFNAHPTKLGVGSIMNAARKLARAELERQAISERMGTQSYMLTALCKSVNGGYEIDAAWAAIVLIVYCASDACGRPLLRTVEAQLTDLDVQTACTLEAYGRGEVTRRARLRAGQQAEEEKKQAAKRRKKDSSALPSLAAPAVPAKKPEIDEATGLVIEDDAASIVNDDDDEPDEGDEDDPLSTERQDQKVLATKRKRASKGNASASTADSHGILSW